MIKNLKKEEKFEDVITEEVTVVDFYATWCGPCQMFSEVLDEYLKTDDINVIKIDIDEHESLAKDYGVMVVPTIMLFKNKEKIRQTTGYMDKKELSTFIKD